MSNAAYTITVSDLRFQMRSASHPPLGGPKNFPGIFDVKLLRKTVETNVNKIWQMKKIYGTDTTKNRPNRVFRHEG